MAYVPFARKYRPQRFEDLVGQAHVTTTLSRALEQKRIAQAYLFAGIRGVGKTSAARILAKALNCAEGPTAQPCNVCSSCVQVTQGNSLDVTEIDGASYRGFDEIRSWRDAVPYAPTTGQFHIYIIDEVHMLTTEAFNALLKTLEEPPAHVKFIFATTAPGKVPATILSRCQRFDFRRIEVVEIVAQLRKVAQAENVQAEDAALYVIARASDGGLRDAEVVLDQLASYVQGTITEPDVNELLGTVPSDALADLALAILERDGAKALSVVAQQRDRGKAAADILTGLMGHMRNLMIVASVQASPSKDALIARLVDEAPERLDRLKEQVGKASAEEWMMIVQLLAGAFDLMRRTPHTQTVLELVLLKLAARDNWQSLDEISRRLSESRGADAPPQPVPARLRTTAEVLAPSAPTAASIRPAADQRPKEEPAMAEAVASLVASTAGAGTELDHLWSNFLQRLRETKMSLAAYLADSRPNRLDGDKVHIGMPGFTLHQEVLTMLDNKRLIEDLLKEVYGRELHVRLEKLDEAAAAAQAQAADKLSNMPINEDSPPALVQDIVKLFNATLINLPPTDTRRSA